MRWIKASPRGWTPPPCNTLTNILLLPVDLGIKRTETQPAQNSTCTERARRLVRPLYTIVSPWNESGVLYTDIVLVVSIQYAYVNRSCSSIYRAGRGHRAVLHIWINERALIFMLYWTHTVPQRPASYDRQAKLHFEDYPIPHADFAMSLLYFPRYPLQLFHFLHIRQCPRRGIETGGGGGLGGLYTLLKSG